MNDLLKTIHDIDIAFLTAEKARLAVESAKGALELAKQDADTARFRLEEALSKAEEAGHPRAKLRKVAEERVSSLLSSGLLKDDSQLSEKPTPKAAKPRRQKSTATEAISAEPTTAETTITDVAQDWADSEPPQKTAETLLEASH